jgi:hypothetical protein
MVVRGWRIGLGLDDRDWLSAIQRLSIRVSPAVSFAPAMLVLGGNVGGVKGYAPNSRWGLRGDYCLMVNRWRGHRAPAGFDAEITAEQSFAVKTESYLRMMVSTAVLTDNCAAARPTRGG